MEVKNKVEEVKTKIKVEEVKTKIQALRAKVGEAKKAPLMLKAGHIEKAADMQVEILADIAELLGGDHGQA